MKGPSQQTCLLVALKAAGRDLTDKELAAVTGLPEPSVRRTRLHLQAAGRVVRGATGYRLRQPWEHPDKYEGDQVLPWR